MAAAGVSAGVLPDPDLPGHARPEPAVGCGCADHRGQGAGIGEPCLGARAASRICLAVRLVVLQVPAQPSRRRSRPGPAGNQGRISADLHGNAAAIRAAASPGRCPVARFLPDRRVSLACPRQQAPSFLPYGQADPCVLSPCRAQRGHLGRVTACGRLQAVLASVFPRVLGGGEPVQAAGRRGLAQHARCSLALVRRAQPWPACRRSARPAAAAARRRTPAGAMDASGSITVIPQQVRQARPGVPGLPSSLTSAPAFASTAALRSAQLGMYPGSRTWTRSRLLGHPSTAPSYPAIVALGRQQRSPPARCSPALAISRRSAAGLTR